MILKKLAPFTFGLVAVLLTGCGTTAKFIYPGNVNDLTQFENGPVYQKNVAVTPFEEMRGDKNQASTYLLYLIPLMPFGYCEYERPDAARMFNTISEFNFDPSEDLAKAAAYSMRKSGLFKEVFFTFGGEKDKAQLLLEGKILSTTYEGTLWTYGLSAFGPLLWFVGLPAGTSKNDLALELKVTEVLTGRKIWEKKYALDRKIVQGLYYRFGHDVRGYPYMMQSIMNDALQDMNQEFHNQGMK